MYLKQYKKFKENSINHNLISYLVEKDYSSTFNIILINTSKNNKDLVNRVNIRCKLIEPKEKEIVYSIIDYPRLISVIEEIRKPYEEIPLIFFQTRNNSKNYFLNFAQQNQENIIIKRILMSI
jgi:hypothetical protein